MFFKAKLAQTYGWSHEYISGMEWGTALEYYNAITPLEAQMALVQMNIATYPHMKGKDARDKFYRQMRKEAYPKELQKQMSFDEFFKAMGHG